MSRPLRLLFVVPHHYAPDLDSALGSHRESASERSEKFARTLAMLHETFGGTRSMNAGRRSIATARNVVDVVVVSTEDAHLMAGLGDAARLATRVVADVPATDLGFAAHRVLAEGADDYDGFGYVEDDILIHDPLLFAKQRWFTTTFGSDSLLQPNRFEASGGLKAYIDGPLPPGTTAGLSQPPGPSQLAASWDELDLVFEHPSNPHAGCFFVDRAQMAKLAKHPRFGIPHASFVRSFETAASGPVAETFRVFKPAAPTGHFLEVEHQGSHYLGIHRVPDPRHVSEAVREAAEARAERLESDLAALHASRSWRITAPLRRLATFVRGTR